MMMMMMYCPAEEGHEGRVRDDDDHDDDVWHVQKENTAGGVRGVGDDVNDDTRTPVRED